MTSREYEQQEQRRNQWTDTMMHCVREVAINQPDLTSEDILATYDKLPESEKINYNKASRSFTSILLKAKNQGLIEMVAGTYRSSQATTSKNKSRQVWKSKIYGQPNNTPTGNS